MEQIDVTSPTWRVIRKEIEARIEQRRNQNEVSHDILITERLRGEIIALRGLLAKYEPPVKEEPTKLDKPFKGALY